jgi:hypothetical protein
MWLATSASEEQHVSSRNENQCQEAVDPAAMVAAAVGAFSAAAGRTRMAKPNCLPPPSTTPDLPASIQANAEINSGAPTEHGKEDEALVKIKPCAPSESRNEKDDSEVEALRLQLDNARREAEEARHLAAENERLRSEMQALAQLKSDATAQASEAPLTPKASCLASPASIASTAAAVRSPRNFQVEPSPPDVALLEQQLLAERRASEKLRLQLFAALQDPPRDKELERDKAKLDSFPSSGPHFQVAPCAHDLRSEVQSTCQAAQVNQLRKEHSNNSWPECVRSEPLIPDVELSTNGVSTRHRPQALEASPAWEWLAASEERHERIRPLHNAASVSFQAMDGLDDHVRMLQSTFHKQQVPTAELVKFTQHFTKALRQANRQWSMAQAQHAGTLLDGVLNQKETEQWTRDWSDLLAEARPANVQVRALMKRLQTLQIRSAKIS